MSGIGVIEVPGLGYESAIVHVETEIMLLVDAELDHDERMDVMVRAMDQGSRDRADVPTGTRRLRVAGVRDDSGSRPGP